MPNLIINIYSKKQIKGKNLPQGTNYIQSFLSLIVSERVFMRNYQFSICI